jgi:hypothetical protein
LKNTFVFALILPKPLMQCAGVHITKRMFPTVERNHSRHIIAQFGSALFLLQATKEWRVVTEFLERLATTNMNATKQNTSESLVEIDAGT